MGTLTKAVGIEVLGDETEMIAITSRHAEDQGLDHAQNPPRIVIEEAVIIGAGGPAPIVGKPCQVIDAATWEYGCGHYWPSMHIHWGCIRGSSAGTYIRMLTHVHMGQWSL